MIARLGIKSYSYNTLKPATSYWTAFESYNSAVRPMVFTLNGGNIYLTSPGKLTMKIFVDGKERAQSITDSKEFNGENLFQPTPIQYIIN